MIRKVHAASRYSVFFLLGLAFSHCGASMVALGIFEPEKKQLSETVETVLLAQNLGLIHRWTMNGNGTDQIGELHFTPVGTPITTENREGLPGSAILFNGTDAYYDTAQEADPILNGSSSSFTISLWVKGTFPTAQNGNLGNFLGFGSNLGMQYYFNASCGNQFRFFTNNNGTGDIDLITDDCNTYQNDRWYHVAVIWDKDTATGYLYVDDRLVAQASGNNTPWTGSTTTLTLGFGALNTSYFFPGSIDDVRIYDRVVRPIPILAY